MGLCVSVSPRACAWARGERAGRGLAAPGSPPEHRPAPLCHHTGGRTPRSLGGAAV